MYQSCRVLPVPRLVFGTFTNFGMWSILENHIYYLRQFVSEDTPASCPKVLVYSARDIIIIHFHEMFGEMVNPVLPGVPLGPTKQTTKRRILE